MDSIELLHVDDIIIYDNDIEQAVLLAAEKLEIEDLKKEGQRPWKACLQLAGKQLFSDKSILKSKVLNIYNNNNIPTNNNSYDIDIINLLCDYYIVLSNKYNKLPSIIAFSYLVNIDYDIIEHWREYEPSSKRYHIWKKLHQTREDCLKDKGYDSNNVVGTISIGNTEFGWNMPGVRNDNNRAKTSGFEALPDLNQPLQIVSNQDTI